MSTINDPEQLIKKVADNLYELLRKNYPEQVVDGVLRNLSVKIKDSSGKVVVITAVETTEKEQKAIKKTAENLTSKETEVEFEVDPKIIGGIIIKTVDKVYDQSIKSGLGKLVREIKTNK